MSEPIKLYHHPFSRAATVVWMLEEVARPYVLEFVDIAKDDQRSAAFLELNPMGKVPVLVDGEAVVTEVAAIGLYLADRYSQGVLAPPLDSPQRGTYLRWSFFPSAVIEPASLAHRESWKVSRSAVGWGDYESVLASMRSALASGPWLLGKNFSMADVIFGSTLRYMTRFGMIEPEPTFSEYIERLSERPALKTADAKNEAVVAERGIKFT